MDDLEVSWHQRRKTPGFSLAALSVLALGTGLNAAMFSAIHTLLFASRPFPEPDCLVRAAGRNG